LQELEDYTRDTLTRAVSEATAGHPSVRVEARVAEGPAAEALISASHRASLLVVGSRGHGGFVGLLLGSVSQQCVTHAPCPVMVMGPYE
jgi:nucleotide-binding universal stress UspA family protein